MKKRLILLLLIATVNVVRAQQAQQYNQLADIVVSAQSGNLDKIEKTSRAFTADRDHLVGKLLEILRSSESAKPDGLDKCAAAYYLGELRAPAASQILASRIKLTPDMSRVDINQLPDPNLVEFPAMRALISIGAPSIQPVAQNLADSDDAVIRKLSLQVLLRIEGDRDVVRLRLEKALKAEADPRKQARLESALKELDSTSFAN